MLHATDDVKNALSAVAEGHHDAIVHPSVAFARVRAARLSRAFEPRDLRAREPSCFDFARELCDHVEAPGCSSVRERAVEATQRVLVRVITPDATTALERSVAAFRAGSARIKRKKWRQAQNLIAARAGLLLSGDLAIARARLAAEAPCSDGLTLDEAMKDLSAFATTRAYAALRERIGFGQRVEVH